jgi:hypothetical protein
MNVIYPLYIPLSGLVWPDEPVVGKKLWNSLFNRIYSPLLFAQRNAN